MTRDEFVEKIKVQLDALNREIGDIEAGLRKMAADANLNAETIRQRREQAQARLRQLQEASQEAWEDLRKGAEVALGALRDALDQARTHFRR